MPLSAIRIIAFALWAMSTITALIGHGQAQKNHSSFAPVIPKIWDDKALARLGVPLAEAAASPVPVSADYYYRMPVRPVYKSYPVYTPGKEPPGYFEKLKQQDPEIVFDPGKLETEADWIRAGELVFDAPIAYEAEQPSSSGLLDVRNPEWYERTGMPTTQDGMLPFTRYVIRKKGVVELGNFSCGMCHTRVMPDGSVIKGAQGSYPFDRVIAFLQRKRSRPEPERLELQRSFIRLLFASPWLRPDPQARAERMPLEEITSLYDAIPPGVVARNGTSPFSPAQVPDLIGIRERRYLDHSGLVLHRGIDDLMRYAALNQDGDLLARYGEFRPIEVVAGKLPDPSTLSRYSDEQLYSLAQYIYSLIPPSNPNKPTALTAKGETVFRREGCAMCHTPPLYTNNKLTPVEGFKVPDDHRTRFDILPLSVGTDPTLTLTTRRGTGYYKVPSLKGVWYRGPFEHNGSLAALEDWFDPRRLRDDYVPTGWKDAGLKTRTVKGHEFGLKLSAEEKKALIAFLKTL